MRIVEFINKWTRTARDFDIILYSPNKFRTYINEDSLDKIEIRDTTESSKISGRLILTYLYRTIRVKKLIKCSKEYDNVFYSSSDFFPDIIPAKRSAKHYGGRWYATVHHIIESPNTRPGNKIRNIIAYLEQQVSLKMIMRHADKILVVSPLVEKYFIDHGVSPERIVKVLNGVNIDYMDSIEPSFEENFDGVFFARLAPSKGIYELADIWAKVCNKIPGAKLAIIGGGSESVKQELLSMFMDKGIGENVKIYGFLDSQRAYSIMKSSKVFVFPSHEEGWGITVAEAMACRLPVVSYDLPVFPHVFPGLLDSVSFKDTNAFSGSIVKLLMDDNKRKEMADKGYDYVSGHYTWERAAKVEQEALDL